MRKKLLFFTFLMIFPIFISAECTYSEKKELNSLASYIDYTYKYDSKKENFTVTLMNINERLEVRYEGNVESAKNGEIVFSGVEEGTQFKAEVFSTVSNECYNEYLRAINISIPYVNPYYNTLSCEGHMELTVCNSEFLDYKISYNTFINLINKTDNEDDVVVQDEEEKTFGDKLLDFIKDWGIKIGLVVISSIVTISIGNIILRKVRHGI